ncbi:hypothetical protein GDO86_001394 [Hymenochirus boettgeri]|uniref:Ig-like domain-containing protein n=1 Tax=Hymenochirus boettgeri TaxID=247094 RepID=A0A8T2KKW6_9PIPI|nr:hypothetical protein GDO86_001394 [Hymenochirus boettgeri]
MFTVEAEKSHYTAEYGGTVNMACHFQMKKEINIQGITVYWEYIAAEGHRKEVIKFHNGTENLSTQNQDYKGRVSILKEELFKGHAILEIRDVQMADTGRYVCIISEKASDYKSVTLAVQAQYKDIHTVITDILTPAGDTVKEIMCQSVGYPKAEVTWRYAKKNISLLVNTSYTVTAANMFNITSIIRVSELTNNTFTCIFWNEAFQEATHLTFYIPASAEHSNGRDKRGFHLTFSAIIVAAIICILIFTSIRIQGKIIKLP